MVMDNKELRGKCDGICLAWRTGQTQEVATVCDELRKRIDLSFGLIKEQEGLRAKFFKGVADIAKDVKKNIAGARKQDKFAASMLTLHDLEAKSLLQIEKKGNEIRQEQYLIAQAFLAYWRKHEAIARKMYLDLIEVEEEIAKKAQSLDLEPVLQLRDQLDSVGMGLELPLQFPVFTPAASTHEPLPTGVDGALSEGSASRAIGIQQAASAEQQQRAQRSPTAAESDQQHSHQQSGAEAQKTEQQSVYAPPDQSQPRAVSTDSAPATGPSSVIDKLHPASNSRKSAPWGSMFKASPTPAAASASTESAPPQPAEPAAAKERPVSVPTGSSTSIYAPPSAPAPPVSTSAPPSTKSEEISVKSLESRAYSAPALVSPEATATSAVPLPSPPSSSSSSSAAAADAPSSPKKKHVSLHLDPGVAVLDQTQFQKQWGSTKVTIKRRGTVAVEKVASLTEEQVVSQFSTSLLVRLFASGFVGDTVKLYLYAQELEGSAVFVSEVIIDRAQGSVTCTHKCNMNGLLPAYAVAVNDALTFLEIDWTVGPSSSPKRPATPT